MNQGAFCQAKWKNEWGKKIRWSVPLSGSEEYESSIDAGVTLAPGPLARIWAPQVQGEACLRRRSCSSCGLRSWAHACSLLSPWTGGRNGACSTEPRQVPHRTSGSEGIPRERTWSMSCGNILPPLSPVSNNALLSITGRSEKFRSNSAERKVWLPFPRGKLSSRRQHICLVFHWIRKRACLES